MGFVHNVSRWLRSYTGEEAEKSVKRGNKTDKKANFDACTRALDHLFVDRERCLSDHFLLLIEVLTW
jgi:hypothetical protein